MFIEKDKIKKRQYKKINGISGNVAVFDQKAHDKYDIKARQFIKDILGDAVIDNPNIYGEDMVFTLKKFPYKYLELQVCAMWEYEYPFKSPFVYARKMKFSKKTLFITFNKFYSQILIFERGGICETPGRLKKYDREHVNFVPWNKVVKMPTSSLSINEIRIYAGEIVDENSEEFKNNDESGEFKNNDESGDE